MTTQFVTAFMDLEEDRSKDKSFTRCFELFDRLAKTNISIIAFVSPHLIPLFHNTYTNVQIVPFVFQSLKTYTDVYSIPDLRLPSMRNQHHDTKHFMILMNAKIEFIRRAMEINASATHFAWIDFSICHVFRNLDVSLSYMHMLGNSALRVNGVYFPGCWRYGIGMENVNQNVVWRFCGGFFIGDRSSLQEMWKLYEREFVRLLTESKTLVWEVNMWAIMEMHCGWKPHWYSAGHDDNIIRIPERAFQVVACLTSIPSRFDTYLHKAVDSIVHQVDRVFLAIPHSYKRFPTYDGALPSFINKYSNVTSVRPEADSGPATKFLGALQSIPTNTWVFVCDDDQEYSESLVSSMMAGINNIGVYQNHYTSIQKKTSGGMIHGYVGCLIHSSCLRELPTFPLPEAARFVDDQWMSIYCFKHAIPIFPTVAETYQQIFKVLELWHEKLGCDALSSLHNRDEKVAELAAYFGVIFSENGTIISTS